MYVKVVLIILFQSTKCYSETVVRANVLEDGNIGTYMKPFHRLVQTPPDVGEMQEISLCFWLFPFRFYKTNSVMSLESSVKESYDISIKLTDGNFAIFIGRCYFKVGISPQLREWTHFCIIFSKIIDVYVNGNFYANHTCYKTVIFPDIQYFNITLGQSPRVRSPYSGKIADFRFYFAELPKDEIKDAAKVNQTLTEYVDVLNTTLTEMTFIVIDTIDSYELTRSYIPYVLIFTTGKKYYKDAENICKNKGGLLPDIDIHGKRVIVELIKSFKKKTGRRFEAFWLNRGNASCLTGFYMARQSDIMLSLGQCSNEKVSFFCIVEKTKTYKLIGFSEDDNIFYPVPNEIGIFDSVSKYRLYLDSRTFVLKDVSDDYIWYKSESRTLNTLTGRYYWYRDDDNETKVEMAFTACDNEEFTCSDGTCTDFKNLCGFVGECPDYSDESFSLCEAGYSPSTVYDKRFPPSTASNYETNIIIDLELSRISNFSAEDSMMTLFFLYVLQWRDERLEFKFLKYNESVDIDDEYASMYWRPDIVVKEAILDDQEKLSCKENPGKVKAFTLHDGYFKVINSSKVMNFEGDVVDLSCENALPVTINCQIDLFFYPFDVQNCTYTLELVNDRMTNIMWDKMSSNITMRPDVTIAVYEITSFSVNFTNAREFTVTMILSRKYGAVIFTTIMPCVITEIVLILTHLIPPSDSYNRVVGTALAETVVANLFASLNTMLPESDEPKMVDVWLFVHILISLLVFINHLLVIEAYEREVLRTDEIGEWRFGVFFRKKKQNKKSAKPEKRVIKTFSCIEHPTCSILDTKADTLNRNLCLFSVAIYILFLLFYFLAVGRHIDGLIGF